MEENKVIKCVNVKNDDDKLSLLNKAIRDHCSNLHMTLDNIVKKKPHVDAGALWWLFALRDLQQVFERTRNEVQIIIEDRVQDTITNHEEILDMIFKQFMTTLKEDN